MASHAPWYHQKKGTPPKVGFTTLYVGIAKYTMNGMTIKIAATASFDFTRRERMMHPSDIRLGDGF